MGSFLLLGLVLGSDSLQFAYNQAVEYKDERQGQREAQHQGIQSENMLSIHQFILGPYYIATETPLLFYEGGVHKYGNHEQHAERPSRCRHYPRNERSSHLGRGYWMADGYVPIRAHDEQKYAAGELVYTRRYHVSFTHGVAEGPALQRHGGYEEGYTDQEAFVGYGQVEDVHVGDRLHLGVSQDHVDDQGVAHESHHADDAVYDLCNQVDDGYVSVGTVDSQGGVVGYIGVEARFRDV